MDNDTKSLLSIRNLKTYFVMDEGTAKAVDGVSFDVHEGQVVGVVGESGCGKSVTIKSVLRIVQKPGRIIDGEILWWHQTEGGQENLIDLAQMKMPFGRYAGRHLIDLPEPYVVWFRKQGLPRGRLGQLLGLLYEIKANGLEHLVRPLGPGGEHEVKRT